MVSDQLQVTVGRPDASGKCRVVALLGDLRHPHTFDPFDQFQRRKFREAIISKFDLPDDAHETLEAAILRAAESDGGALFKPVVTMLDTVTPTQVEWLWPNKLAIGKNNLLCGDPGLGKSLTALDVAARLSSGNGFPDEHDAAHDPAGVVILTMEDDASDTIVPRLLDHGADLARIGIVQGLTEVDGDGKTIHGIDLLHDIDAVREAVKQVANCKLVIVDTISDYLGSKVDTHKNRDVRAVMNPMAALANECRVANLLISHLRKGEGQAIHSAMGSIGFVGQARVAWAITRCQTNPKRRLMTCIKNNLADDTSGLGFAIESYGTDNGPVICWETEPVRMSADEAMAQQQRRGRKPVEREGAADWLAQQLADGPKLAGDILDDAEAEGFGRRTVQRAFQQLDGQRSKAGMQGGWLWSLGEDDTEGDTESQSPSFCHLRHLRKNTEDDSIERETNTTVCKKVTDCERQEFEAERLRCNGQPDVPF